MLVENALHPRARDKIVLGLLEELDECGDDDSLDSIKARLQQVLNRVSVYSRIEHRFVERYKRGECSAYLHVQHLSLGEVEAVFGFCSVLHSHNRTGVHHDSPVSNCGFVSSMGLGFGDMEVSMFVDVRENSESSQKDPDIPTIVGLHRLNECERFYAYPRKRAVETIEYGRVFRTVDPEREGALFFPVEGQNTAPIQLDQLECQMIESRSNLVDCLTSEDGNSIGRGLDKLQFSAAIRVLDDHIRLALVVVPANVSYCFNVLLCPDEFERCGFEARNHS